MSIMHYPSMINSAAGKAFTAENMPLVAWKAGGETYAPPQDATSENAGILWFNREPTESDLKAVKMLYPWEG